MFPLKTAKIKRSQESKLDVTALRMMAVKNEAFVSQYCGNTAGKTAKRSH